MNNGYTKISINGEDIGLKFGMPAVMAIRDRCKDIDLGDSVTMASLGVPHILHEGYCNNCLVKGEPKPYKHDFQFFYDAVEDAFMDEEKMKQYQEAIAFFNESKFVEVGKAEMASEKEVKKKNGHPRKLKPSVTVS